MLALLDMAFLVGIPLWVDMLFGLEDFRFEDLRGIGGVEDTGGAEGMKGVERDCEIV